VRAAVDAGRVPLILAGSCVTCQGVLAGLDDADRGAVWLDAHAESESRGQSCGPSGSQDLAPLASQRRDPLPFLECTLTMERLRQLVATHRNGFRLSEPFLVPSHLPLVATGCDRWAP
jgi:hypothetical protein